MRCDLATVLPLLPVVLLTVPAASACSLAGQPPEPGAFLLWDTASGELRRVNVEHRSLGATCELSNRHDLSTDHLAWVGSDERVRVLDRGSGDVSVVWEGPPPARDVAVGGGWALVVAGEGVHAVELATGTTEGVVLELGPSQRAWGLDGVVVAYDRGEETFTVLDAATRDLLVADATRAELGLPEEAWVQTASPRWLVFSVDDGVWAVDVDARASHSLPDARRVYGGWMALDGDALVASHYAEGERVLRAMDLRDPSWRDVGVPPYKFLGGAAGGTVVLGAYSLGTGPDLGITAAHLQRTEAGGGRAVVTVANQGNAHAGASRVLATAGEAELDAIPLPALPPGEARGLDLGPWPGSATAQGEPVRVVLDADDDVDETVEGNNVVTFGEPEPPGDAIPVAAGAALLALGGAALATARSRGHRR